MNTWFIKRLSHLPTFHNGDSKTQIDYILIRRRHFTTVTDCKVVPYETIAPQHRPLTADLRIKPPIKQCEERIGPRNDLTYAITNRYECGRIVE